MQNIYDKLTIPPEHIATSIGREEGEYIFELVGSKPVNSTMETGFAYGCSAAYILAATNAPHIAIDPYEHNYSDLGLHNIAKLGLEDRLELIKLPSHIALPQLVVRGVSVDFGFIDGGHLFDEIFIDWYYIDLLLNKHGHVMFHDRWLKATQMVASFIRNNRKEYREVRTPIPNIFLFEKTGQDERVWPHFSEFYTDKP
jgi:predicted O-methyltransferase YrrM